MLVMALYFIVRNSGTGNVTIDPQGTDTVATAAS